MIIFTGNSNAKLAHLVAHKLGVDTATCIVTRFSDGEPIAEIQRNVRGKSVFLIQSICPPSSSEALMELLVMIDACKRASAREINVVMPYLGFARQDRRPPLSRVSITAKLVANLIHTAGAFRVVTIDLHAEQIEGFFDCPVDNIYASPVLIADILGRYNDLIVVSPDVGGVARSRAIAKRLNNAQLAIIDKRRPMANQSEVMNIIGKVDGKTCVIVDDIIDTAGTVCRAANALVENGAKRVVSYATHPVFSGDAIKNIEASCLHEVVVTDTIPLREDANTCSKVRQLSVCQLLAEVVRCVDQNESIRNLYDNF